jgi:trans-aconitate methyltransferase
VIERLYEEVLKEGAIIDWFKDPGNRPTLKQLEKELTMMGLFMTSPPTMAVYVNDFLQKNFPSLGSDIVHKITEFISNNPQILDWLKG